MMRLAISIGLVGVVLACGTARDPELATRPHATARATVSAAVKAFERYDLAASRKLYEAVDADPASSADDRAVAALALATYDWRFDTDAASAIRRLDRALASATAKAPLLRYRGRVRLETGQLGPAREDADHAIAASSTPVDLADARLLAADVALALGEPAYLAPAVAHVEAVIESWPGRPEACEALLGLALQLDDGPRVLRAWRCYFFVADALAVNEVLRASQEALVALAASWRGRPPTPSEQRSLAIALARSGFHDHAVRVAAKLAGTPEATAELRDLHAYHQFLERIRAINRDFYPRAAKGLRDYEAAYDQAVHVAARTLWEALGSPPPATLSLEQFFERFFELLRTRFAVEGYLGTTMGYYGMLAGHVIHDERRQVEQHGRVAELRYVSIDRLISRDFTSWYGTTNVGGWGTETTMFQVRAAYTGEPLRRLSWVTDATAREKVLHEIATLQRDDLARCTADPYAPPTAVAIRLRLVESERLFAELRRGGVAERALAFVSETLRLNVEATVFAHEGRHALDQRYVKAAFDAMSEEERELRAKYSEVVFSSNPRLALTGSILGGTDETTGHGKANRRFRKLVVDWMQQHSDEIPGLDRSRPLVMQIDRLDNRQLVAIIKAVDRM